MRNTSEKLISWLDLDVGSPQHRGLAHVLARQAAQRRFVTWMTIALFLLLAVLLASERAITYEDRISFAEQNAMTRARLLEEHTQALIRKIDIVLTQVADEMSGRLHQGTLRDGDIAPLLARSLHQIPESQSLRIVGVNGRFRHDATGIVPDVFVGDREYFLRHRDHPQAGLVISEPIFARVTSNWVITLSRRLNDPQGHFIGVVQAAINADAFASAYAQMATGKDSLSLYSSRQMALIARYPQVPLWLGKTLQLSPLVQQYQESPTGHYRYVSELDGIERIYAYRQVGQHPLVAVVGIPVTSAMQGWLSGVIAYCVLGAVLALLGGIMLLHMYRKDRFILSLAHEMESSHLALLQSMPDMAWINDREGRIRYANERYTRYVGKPLTEIIGQPVAGIWPESVNWCPDDGIPEQGTTHRHVIDIEVAGEGLRHLEIIRNPIIDNAQCIIGAVGISHDMTEQYQAENHRRLTSQVFEQSNDGIMITDARQHIVAVNRAFSEITGYGEDEALGQTPRLLQSGVHDGDFYTEMWERILQEGCWRGEVVNRRKCGSTFTEWLTISAITDERGHVTHYVAVFMDISQRKRDEAKIYYLAHYDTLTSLPNRLLFNDRLNQKLNHAQRYNTRFALAYIDIDGFKKVNEGYGYALGDTLLKEMGARLRDCLRANDTVCRYGDDAFLALVDEINSMPEMVRVCERIQEAVAPAFYLAGLSLPVTVSIGVAMYPTDGRTLEDLILNADTAMFFAKSQGRNNYQFFTQEMNREARAHAQLVKELHQAVAQGEFVLHYQPKYAMHSGEITGMEALIRWQHPQRGLLMPDQFIAVTEKTRLINQIWSWMLVDLARQLEDWQGQGIQARPVALNVSAIQFAQPGFLEELLAAIDSGTLPAAMLELEITETILLDPNSDAIAALHALRAAGIRISLDDFGTGYSSLNYLTHLPLDVLKIDRSFVASLLDNPRTQLVVENIIQLSQRLGLDVIAEGVETHAQAELLQALGCQIAQGYLYSRPLPANELSRLLGQTTPLPHTAH